MPILQTPSRRGHVPAGGTIGQVITKLSSDNWDYNWANAAGTFLDLTDTPSSYAGQGGKVVSVNVGETGLEFTTAGAGGGVSSFSAGNLSPLFTTSVATATTTPALSFTLSNAAAHTFFGNNTGSTGAPSYVRPAFTDLANLSGTSRLLGAGASGAAVSEITPGTGIYFSGSTINATTAFTVNVKSAPYNAAGDGVTDDTTAIQSAINDVWNAGGGTIFFPNGTYLVNGAFDATTNSILKIPFNDGTINKPKSIVFWGETPVPWIAPGTGLPDGSSCAVIKSTKTGTGTRPAIIAGAAFNAAPTINQFNYTDVYFHEMMILLPGDPTLDALRFDTTAGLSIENVIVAADPATVSPTHATVGVWMPGNNNHNLCYVNRVIVSGFDTGIKISEQFNGVDVQVGSCNFGIDCLQSSARSRGNFWIGWCPYAVTFSGQHSVDFVINFERGVGDWRVPVYDVYDVSDNGTGSIKYKLIQSGVGPVDEQINANNASNLRFENLFRRNDVTYQTTNYTPIKNDYGRLIRMDGTNLTLTLPNPGFKEISFWIRNDNATDLTISRNGLTINGGASDITLKQHQLIQVWYYQGFYFATTPLVAGTNITLTPASNGLTIASTGGGGTPGGANTQIQFNDSGAFGGDADLTWDKTANLLTLTGNITAASNFNLTLPSTGAFTLNQNPAAGTPTFGRVSVNWNNTNGTSKSSQFQWQGSGTALWSIVNDLATSGVQDLAFFDNVNSHVRLYFGASNKTGMALDTVFGWNNSTSIPVSAIDTGFARNGAGVVEINNGTAGSFGSLKCDRVDAATGYRIAGVAAAGKILIGNGTDYVASTPTYPNASATTGKIIQSDGTNFVASTATWPTNVTTGYDLLANGTNYVAYPADLFASSTAAVSAAYASDTYLAGSTITIAAGDWKVQGQYKCTFDMTKTAAGTATPIITVRMGTLGTTGDAAIATITFAAGTGAADTGIFDVYVTFRSVGSGTSAVIQAVGRCTHHLAATGLTTTGASGTGIILATSSGFNSTTQTKIGLSFNGGTSFSGTNTFVQAALTQP